MSKAKILCEMCGKLRNKRNSAIMFGVLCCGRCKRKGSITNKNHYVPVIRVNRRSGIDFSGVLDQDIERLIKSLRRPLRWSEKKILWNEYKKRGIGELEAKERLSNLETGIARTKVIKKLKKKQEKAKPKDFKTAFELLTKGKDGNLIKKELEAPMEIGVLK